jgi:hypothetical protein
VLLASVDRELPLGQLAVVAFVVAGAVLVESLVFAESRRSAELLPSLMAEPEGRFSRSALPDHRWWTWCPLPSAPIQVVGVPRPNTQVMLLAQDRAAFPSDGERLARVVSCRDLPRLQPMIIFERQVQRERNPSAVRVMSASPPRQRREASGR